jgi:hypothetical protein
VWTQRYVRYRAKSPIRPHEEILGRQTESQVLAIRQIYGKSIARPTHVCRAKSLDSPSCRRTLLENSGLRQVTINRPRRCSSIEVQGG